VPIIDNILRAVPNITEHARTLQEASREELETVLREFDRERALAAAEDAIRSGPLE